MACTTFMRSAGISCTWPRVIRRQGCSINTNNNKTCSYEPRVLMLDLDGVISRYPPADVEIKKQVIRFVQKSMLTHLGQTVEFDYAEVINETLYTQHGHTLIGLAKELNINVSTHEFNQAVYTETVLNKIRHTFSKSAHHNAGAITRAWDTRNLVERSHLSNQNIEAYIFTNSPTVWTEFVLDLLSLKDLFPRENWITSDHPSIIDDDQRLFKPDHEIYDIASSIAHTKNIIFVDDTLQNLFPVMHNWKTYFMDNHQKHSLNMINHRDHQMGDINVIQHLNDITF